LSTETAIIDNAYAAKNKKKVFLNPVVNSNGLFEKGVHIVKVNVVRKFTSAKIVVNNNSKNADK
jgi:hypothetical protein